MFAREQSNRSVIPFFVLVLVTSLPFWFLGALVQDWLPDADRMNLPISALMTFSPLIAGSILCHRDQGWQGVARLLGRAIDWKRVKAKGWIAIAILIMPVITAITWGIQILLGLSDGAMPMAWADLPVLIVVFLIAAGAEEIGWQGYVYGPMEKRWNVLGAGIALGIFWAAWHIVPYLQAGQNWIWIAGQCCCSVGLRVLIVWIYKNTRESVFASLIVHAASNVSVFMLPATLTPAGRVIAAAVTCFAAVGVFFGGPRRLVRSEVGQRVE